MVQDVGVHFKVRHSEIEVYGVGFRVQGLLCRAEGLWG